MAKNSSINKILHRELISINAIPQIFKLWSFLESKRRSQFFLVLLLTVFTSFAELISIGAVIPFLTVISQPDGLSENKFFKNLLQFSNFHEEDAALIATLFFIAAIFVSGVMRVLLLWAQTTLSHSIGAELSSKIYKTTLYQPYAVHLRRNSSEIISGILMKVESIVGGAINPSLMILSSSCMLLSIIFMLFIIQPLVALVALFGFGFIYVFAVLFNKKAIAHSSEVVSKEHDKVVKALQEGLGGIRDVLLNGTQSEYCELYRASDVPMRKAYARITLIGGSPRYIVEVFSMVMITLLAYGMRSNSSMEVLPILGGLALGGQKLLPCLQQLYLSWSSIQASKHSVRDALALLGQKMPDYLKAQSGPSITFNKSVMIDRVNFSYERQGPIILKDIKLTIEKGDCLGIIGKTGSGKSTLLDILMGLLIPDSGGIYVDGALISEKNVVQWQKFVAHVPQMIFLSDATIAENIAFGIEKSKIDYTRLVEVAAKARLLDVIEAYENKFDTVIGEKGMRLSGGQRQRIAIARALYKDAKILVFDEATSALDDATEGSVMDAISNLQKEITIIMVAHRLTTLRQCNQIVELRNGIISRAGTYQQIINGFNN